MSDYEKATEELEKLEDFDFDTFLEEASKLVDTGVHKPPPFDPNAPDIMNWRVTF